LLSVVFDALFKKSDEKNELVKLLDVVAAKKNKNPEKLTAAAANFTGENDAPTLRDLP
jgi:hypothetical protein